MAEQNNTTEAAFNISRSIHAPRELVYQAWSQADHLLQWWGAKGMPISISQFNFKPGGKFHYCMKGPNNFNIWGIFEYQEMTAPEKITYISSFSNEAGEITKAPFPMDWPAKVHNTLTLKEESGKTILKLESRPINPTPEQAETFQKMNDSMQQGFGGTLDLLEEYVARLKKD
ncbi:MAG: SRPBCC family protein [Verrucomicrobiales bacterium]